MIVTTGKVTLINYSEYIRHFNDNNFEKIFYKYNNKFLYCDIISIDLDKFNIQILDIQIPELYLAHFTIDYSVIYFLVIKGNIINILDGSYKHSPIYQINSFDQILLKDFKYINKIVKMDMDGHILFTGIENKIINLLIRRDFYIDDYYMIIEALQEFNIIKDEVENPLQLKLF